MEQFTVKNVLDVLVTLNIDQKNPRPEPDKNCWYGAPPEHSEPSCLLGHVLYGLDRELFAAVADVTVAWAGVPNYVRRSFDEESDYLLLAMQTHADSTSADATWRQTMEHVGIEIDTIRTVSLGSHVAEGRVP